LMNYNGDKTTNLIGRDLMTPEEVKQLHYKTIIFPIIGFPIFRDTVLYNKFSCYESGKVERNSNPLKDLSYTYFTVEQIKHDIKEKRKPNPREVKEMNQSLEQADKDNLKLVEEAISKIFKNGFQIKYVIGQNHRTYMCVTLDRALKQRERSLLNSKVKAEYYHSQITEKNNKTIIEIHNENPDMKLLRSLNNDR
ncbi:MAG: hypothetical protein Q4E75_06840, partial [bacterium]|nr:hypothetical protein [bacterium]